MKRFFSVLNKEGSTSREVREQSLEEIPSPNTVPAESALPSKVACASTSTSSVEEVGDLDKKHYPQKPRDAWMKDDSLKDWIIIKGEEVECKYCRTIFKKPKLSNIKEHAKTSKHISASQPFSSNRQSTIAFANKKTSYKVHESEARTCLFIAKHASINSVDHLINVSKLNYCDSQVSANTKLHRSKCAAIIKNAWYPYLKDKIVKDVGNSPYSLLIDESTDISVVKYLGVVVKYYSESDNVCKTSLLKLQPLVACDANAIVEAILSVLNEYKLKIEKMCGLGTDNASVMTGIRSGVIAKLNAINPKIILIPCVCHSLQLATSAAATLMPKEIEFIISETYNWFARSSNRQQSYQTLFKLINDGHDPLKITQSCNTRWLSIESAVTRVHQQYLELSTYFEMCERTANCFKITSLTKMYKDEINYAYLCFLKPLLQQVQRVNKMFESETVDFVKVLRDLELLILVLINKVVRSDESQSVNTKLDIDKVQLQIRPHLGVDCEEKLLELQTKKVINNEQLEVFRSNCKGFIVKLIHELQQRMPKNLNVLKQISYLSIDECMRVKKQSLSPILQEMQIDSLTAEKICNQWNTLLFNKWQNTECTEKFWCEVFSFKDASGENPFFHLSYFAISVLVLPISNAEVERIFSQLNLVKTKQRNRMQLRLTNSILLIRNNLRNIRCCHNYDIPSEVVQKIGTNAIYKDEQDTEFDEGDEEDFCL